MAPSCQAAQSGAKLQGEARSRPISNAPTYQLQQPYAARALPSLSWKVKTARGLRFAKCGPLTGVNDCRQHTMLHHHHRAPWHSRHVVGSSGEHDEGQGQGAVDGKPTGIWYDSDHHLKLILAESLMMSSRHASCVCMQSSRTGPPIIF